MLRFLQHNHFAEPFLYPIDARYVELWFARQRRRCCCSCMLLASRCLLRCVCCLHRGVHLVCTALHSFNFFHNSSAIGGNGCVSASHVDGCEHFRTLLVQCLHDALRTAA